MLLDHVGASSVNGTTADQSWKPYRQAAGEQRICWPLRLRDPAWSYAVISAHYFAMSLRALRGRMHLSSGQWTVEDIQVLSHGTSFKT